MCEFERNYNDSRFDMVISNLGAAVHLSDEMYFDKWLWTRVHIWKNHVLLQPNNLIVFPSEMSLRCRRKLYR